MIRVRVVGNVTHGGKQLERGQVLDLPAVHCGAAIRKGDFERVEEKPKRKNRAKRNS